jgi:DeoR/GlpR family transcriptional regulator of sugar metabolism
VADRLDVTLRLVRNAGRASLADLAARLGVSEMTVRRDLDALQARGLVERVRGGAVAVAGPESGFAARAGWQAGLKDRIGRAAAARVEPGSTVLLDAGTTTVHVARALADRAAAGEGPFTAAVVSLPVADALADRPGVRLLVVGGESRPGERSLAGPLTAAVLRQLTFDLFVMSIGAVSAAAGWSEFTLEDAAVKQVGLQQARSTLVVADASKLGVRAFASVAPLDAVGRLVTDASARDPQLTPAAQETLAALDDAGVEVDLV